MNIIKSLQCKWRNYQIAHYAKSAYGRELASLKNIHVGRRCFIIGNGPSLQATDLNVLAKHNEITFAFNRIYNIFEQTSWRPTYYISQDEKMLRNTWEKMCTVPAKERFFPIEMKWYYNIPLHNALFFHQQNPKDILKPIFSENISQFIGNSKTVAFTAMQLAVYMGIREIYLIGTDHHFHTSINAKGEIIVDPTARDYFCDAYNIDKKDLYIPNTDESTYTFIAAKQYGDAHGIKIFNATRGGKLEVYPRVSFDELFK